MEQGNGEPSKTNTNTETISDNERAAPPKSSRSVESSPALQVSGDVKARDKRAVTERPCVKRQRKRKGSNSKNQGNVLRNFREKKTKSNSQDVVRVVSSGGGKGDLSRDEVSMPRVEEQRENDKLSSKQQTDASKLPIVTAKPGSKNREKVRSSNSCDSIVLFDSDNSESFESEDSETISRKKVLDFLVGMVNSCGSDSELGEDMNKRTASVKKEVAKHSSSSKDDDGLQITSAKDIIFVDDDDIEVLFVKQADKEGKVLRKDYTSGTERDEKISVGSETSSDATRDDSPEDAANLHSTDSHNTETTENSVAVSATTSDNKIKSPCSKEASKEDSILTNNRKNGEEESPIVLIQGSIEDTTHLLSADGPHNQMTEGPVSVHIGSMENKAGGSTLQEAIRSAADRLLRNGRSCDKECVQKVCIVRESPSETPQRNPSEGDTNLPSASGVHSDSPEDRMLDDSTSDENEIVVAMSKETDVDDRLVRNNRTSDAEHDVETVCVRQALLGGTAKTNTSECDLMPNITCGLSNLINQKCVNDLPDPGKTDQAHIKIVPLTEIVTNARWIESTQIENVPAVSPLPQIIDVRSLVDIPDSTGSLHDGKKEIFIKDTECAYIKIETLSTAWPSSNEYTTFPNVTNHTALQSTNGEGSTSRTKSLCTVLPSSNDQGLSSRNGKSALPSTSAQDPFITTEKCEKDPSDERSSTSLLIQSDNVSTHTPSSIAKTFPVVNSCLLLDRENHLNVDKNNNENTNNLSGTSNCLPRGSVGAPSLTAQKIAVVGNRDQEPTTVNKRNGQSIEVGNKKYLSIVRPLLQPNGLRSISKPLTGTEKQSRSNNFMTKAKLNVCHDHCYYNESSAPEEVRNIIAHDLPRSGKRALHFAPELQVSKKRKTSTTWQFTAMQSRAGRQNVSKLKNRKSCKTKGANLVRSRIHPPNPAGQKADKQQSLVLPQNTCERMKKQTVTAVQNRASRLRVPNSTSNVDILSQNNGHNQENESTEDRSKCGDGATHEKNVARFDSCLTKRENTETKKVVAPENHITGVCKTSVANKGNKTSNGDTSFTRIQPPKVLTHSQGCQTISSESDDGPDTPGSSDSTSEGNRRSVRSPSIFEFLRPNSESVIENGDTFQSLENNRWSSTEDSSEQYGKEIYASTKGKTPDLSQDKSDVKSNPSQSVKMIETFTRYENVEKICNGQPKYTAVCSKSFTKTKNGELHCNNSQRCTKVANCHQGNKRPKFRNPPGNSEQHQSTMSNDSELKFRRSPRKVNCKRKRSSCQFCDPCRRRRSTDAIHCRKRSRVQSSYEYHVHVSNKGVQASELQNSEVQSSNVQSSDVQSSEVQSSETESSWLPTNEESSSWEPSSGHESDATEEECGMKKNRYANILRPVIYRKGRKRLTRCFLPQQSKCKRRRLMKRTISSTTSEKSSDSENNQKQKVQKLLKICNLDAVVKLVPL